MAVNRSKDMFRIIREFLLRKNRSNVPSGLMPLKDVKSVAILVDMAAEDAAQVIADASAFFGKNGVQPEFISVKPEELNRLGIPAKAKLDMIKACRPDLFISLPDSNEFYIKYIQNCIHAPFKVGVGSSDNSLSLVLTPREGEPLSQKEALAKVKEILLKIQA